MSVIKHYFDIQQRIRNCRLSINNILTPPEGADEDVWKYEHLRQFCQELNGLATRLQVECTPTTCPQVCQAEGKSKYIKYTYR